MTPATIVTLLRRFNFGFSNELDLQLGIAEAFEREGLTEGADFEREVRLNDRDRIDFMVGETGIEVKIAGGGDALVRQCARYLDLARVQALIVVVGSRRLAASLPSELRGKPLSVVNVRGRL